MNIIEVVGHVDEGGQLHVILPPDLKPGPVKVALAPLTEQDEDDAWRALINHSWARDWSDPREDIYTLEDGEPSHEPG